MAQCIGQVSAMNYLPTLPFMGPSGGNYSDFGGKCCLKFRSLVDNVPIFFVPAVLLNYFFSCYLISCYVGQSNFEENTIPWKSIKLPALVALSWIFAYMNRKKLLKEGRSRVSFHTWSFCCIFPLQGRMGRICAVPLRNLGPANPAVCEALAFQAETLAPILFSWHLAFLFWNQAALLLSVIFVWESCLTQPNKITVNKSEVSYGDSDKVS